MTSPDGRQLVETYRQLQLRLGTDGAAAAVKLYERADDPAAVTGWMMRILVGQHDQSARAASTFHNRLRALEGAPGRFVAAPATIPPDVLQSAADWYRYLTTIVYERHLDAGDTPDQAAEVTATRWSGSVARHVRNGGRRTLSQSMANDPSVTRYERVTDGDPCDWCAMLAGRGPVYESEQSAGGTVQWHDFCGCVAVPFWRD